MHGKRKISQKIFFRFFEKNSCKSFFGGYNRAHEKHIRCFSPLPFRTYGGFVMATRKEINVNSLTNFATNMLSCIHHYRKDNAEVLSPKQHENLDELAYSAMELISIANIMPPKKQVGYRVDNILNRASRNIGNVLSFKERIEKEPLYITYLNFFTFAEVVLNKYTHKDTL